MRWGRGRSRRRNHSEVGCRTVCHADAAMSGNRNELQDLVDRELVRKTGCSSATLALRRGIAVLAISAACFVSAGHAGELASTAADLPRLTPLTTNSSSATSPAAAASDLLMR